MIIISLQAENLKRLVAVEIKPNTNLVVISGRNGAGKTSVLDSIWWALCGAKHIQVAPIRTGAKEARISLHLKGAARELIVTRSFRRKEDGGYTTSITVAAPDGALYTQPQTILDALLGELSFDPLAFARMESREQLDALRKFVPGVDFQKIEGQNRADYDRRTTLNRAAKEARAAAGGIVVPADTPALEIEERQLDEELQKAGEHNTQIERRQANRDRMAERAKALSTEAEGFVARAVELQRQADDLRTQAEQKATEATDLAKQLKEAEPLPARIDPAPIRARMEKARAVNANVRRAGERAVLLKRAEGLDAAAEELTGTMKKRDADKRAAIASAAMPIDGLSFGDAEILLNGLPFSQASDAEQLRVSVAIAAALNPMLHVIRIRDGSLLDEDAMRALEAFANAADFQLWVEKVSSTGEVGFVIEDGHVKGQQIEQPRAANA